MPRAGLSRAAVVELGAQLADETGPDRLTLAGVAARAGVRLPSLYKHVGGLDDLQRGVAVLALREVRDRLADAAVEITYEYDVDGILHVVVRDIATARVFVDEQLAPGAGRDPSELAALREHMAAWAA